MVQPRVGPPVVTATQSPCVYSKLQSRARIVTWEYGFDVPKYGARGGGLAALLRRFQAGYVLVP
jgi:uncharacterized protein YfaQ (DUF2300 family)